MELRIEPYNTPERPIFNYDELMAAVQEKMALYEAAIYTEEQIRQAKLDKASLNKLCKALNDERIKREREYMMPFNQFKAQVNEIIAVVNRPIQAIDKQIKAVEERKREEKYAQIEDFWNACELPAPIKLLQIMDTKWLNASVSMKSIQDEITARLEQIASDLAVVRNLPEYAFEAEQAYMSTFDLAKAVSEAHRRSDEAKRRAEWEAEKQRRKAEQDAMRQAAYEAELERRQAVPAKDSPADNSSEPKREWLRFKALLTVDDAKALKNFFISRGIEFEAI